MSAVKLITVVTENFLPGALAMLDSFRRSNPWFKGAATVISDGLSPQSQRLIRMVAPAAQFAAPSPALTDAIDALSARHPDIERRRPRFWALDALAPGGADGHLFIDSDVVFTGSVQPLLDCAADMAAIGDMATLRGVRRRRSDYALAQPEEEALPFTFNSGVMYFRSPALGGADHAAALAVLREAPKAAIATGYADQMVFNLHFADRCARFDWRYNYLMGFASDLEAREPEARKDLRALHFNTAHKPWNLNAAAQAAAGGHAEFWAQTVWLGAWRDALATLRLRAALSPVEESETP